MKQKSIPRPRRDFGEGNIQQETELHVTYLNDKQKHFLECVKAINEIMTEAINNLNKI